ncbi:hypothetical protein K1718_09680 [Roseibium porphyridii]|uniref:Holin n=1 Tax=Roseibium porphyridii TaxID=2866279 RepID=A0ABY8FGB2_9HYPH|nr:hypothetical protein [Roseibium sp. KMA01]WFE91608.1 hypothetical protein K1718_09680 [Roseibium sp. KMA01]
MKLIIGWRRVLARAWSVRLMLLAALLSGAEVALPFLGDIIEPGRLALLSALATAGAFVARILVQKDMKDGT